MMHRQAKGRHTTACVLLATTTMLTVLGLVGGAVGGVAGGATSSSSAPGVTSSTVTVGQIDDLSKPVPGLFKAAEDGTQAYFNYVDSTGGINGRKIKLQADDSQFDSSTVVSDTESIAKSDFAMVGGYSLVDGSEQPVVNEQHLPDVTYPLSSSLANDKYVYSPTPSTTNDTPDGPYLWAKKAFKDDVDNIGILYPAANSTTIDSELRLESVMKDTGLKINYRRGFSEDESTFTADVLKMKDSGIKMYYDQELPGLYASTLASETAQQGFHPVDVQGIAAYTANMASSSGGAANGMYLEQGAPLFEGEDAKAIPEVALFDKWVLKVDPKVFASVTPLPAFDGWVSGMLFAQALKAAGANPTRAGLIDQLNKVTDFTANGMLPPGENPAKNIPSRCFIVAQLKSGKWARVSPTPSKGFICTGKLHPKPGWKPQTR